MCAADGRVGGQPRSQTRGNLLQRAQRQPASDFEQGLLTCTAEQLQLGSRRVLRRELSQERQLFLKRGGHPCGALCRNTRPHFVHTSAHRSPRARTPPRSRSAATSTFTHTFASSVPFVYVCARRQTVWHIHGPPRRNSRTAPVCHGGAPSSWSRKPCTDRHGRLMKDPSFDFIQTQAASRRRGARHVTCAQLSPRPGARAGPP
jgi:hypothetical protein